MFRSQVRLILDGLAPDRRFNPDDTVESTSGTASGNSQLTVSAAGAGDFEG